MAEVVRDKDSGQYYVRAGGNQLFPITEEQVPTAQETDAETFINSVGNSVMQLATGVGAALGVPNQREAFDELQQTQQVRSFGSPVAAGAGTIAPDVVVGALTGGTGTIAKRVGTTALVEGALGGARSPDDPLTGALLQGTVGGVTAGAIPLAVRFTNTANAVVAGSRARAAQPRVQAPMELAARGYVDPWYAGRGKVAQQVGAAMESYAPINLLTRAGERAADNQSALNRTVMQDMYVRRPDKADGVDAQVQDLGELAPDDTLSPAFFDMLEQRFRDDYADIGERMSGAVLADSLMKDGALNTQLHEIAQNSVTSVVRNSELDNILTRVINRIDSKDRPLTTQSLLDMRSDLSTYATQQATSATGDKAAARTVSSVVTAIDEAMTRALQKFGKRDLVDDWKDVTRRYMVMQAALEGRAVDIASGNVNARTMMNNLYKPRRRKSGQDTVTFRAASHYANNATTGIPDSGTATRQLLGQTVATGLAVAGGASLIN